MGSTQNEYDSIVQIEARALKEGIKEATKKGLRKLEIEGDNLTVINATCGIGTSPWEIDMFIADIWMLFRDLETISIRL